MDYQIGQTGLYEYRHGGKSKTVAARVVATDKSAIQIEFAHPVTIEYKRGTKTGNYPHRRWLRSREDRARFH